ncbi:MAG: nuclear transport factor 2 family protein [Candidatus Velthaea sp.]|jgi:hypothetical protein
MRAGKLFTAVAVLNAALGLHNLALANPASGPTPSIAPAEVVRKEVIAFNAHDAVAVAKWHGPDAKLRLVPQGKVLATGRTAITAFFKHVFDSSPNVRITLQKQLVLGRMVINYYSESGSKYTAVISTYQVENGSIANEWITFG